MKDYQNIPSVDSILSTKQGKQLIGEFGRALVVNAIHQTLNELRQSIASGNKLPKRDWINSRIREVLENLTATSLTNVINATGIILHTNLGRAPLSEETIAAINAIAGDYTNLEYDLGEGKRGKREIHTEKLLKTLTGAESALVVNNNASAVLLILTALARRKRVVISNSQLVEIGGGFRIPDVMRQSGAKLSAIGTTNRVHIADYENALEDPTALVMSAHHSNFKIIGFTKEPSYDQIASVAKQANIPYMIDLGSGALLDTAEYGLQHEPTVQEALKSGADLVCFSGDKLLGGPQAGIVLGRYENVEKLKKHPLARAMRADKLCLAGLSATLVHYLKGEAVQKIPIWKMIAMTRDEIRERAENWKKIIGRGEVIAGESMVGGGSLPTEVQPTFLYALEGLQATKFHQALRTPPNPIVSRIEDKRILFDPRTVLIEDEQVCIDKITKLLNVKQ